jgi:hypothetical protein
VATNANGICTGVNSTQNKLDDWNEWYLDIHHKKCLANVKKGMTARILSAKEKGCDGVDPDNVDSASLISSYLPRLNDRTDNTSSTPTLRCME